MTVSEDGNYEHQSVGWVRYEYLHFGSSLKRSHHFETGKETYLGGWRLSAHWTTTDHSLAKEITSSIPVLLFNSVLSVEPA